MPRDASITWGTWEGVPTALDTFECWCWDGARWVEVDRAEACTKVPVLGKAMFDSMYGRLPPLPEEAFRPHPLRDAAGAVLGWVADAMEWWRHLRRRWQ